MAFASPFKRCTSICATSISNRKTDHNAIKNRSDAVTSDPFTIEEDGQGYFKQKGYRTSAEALYDFNSDIRLRWITSYERGYTADLTDGDRTATAPPRPPSSNVGRISYAKTTFNTLVHEVNLLSTGDGAFDWVVGAFYLDESIPVTLLRDNNHTVNFVSSTSTIITEADNTSKSVFGQVGWKFAPQWKAIVGARYSQDQQVYKRIASPGGVGTGVQKSEEPTGRVALNWTPTDDALYYVSLSKGYKAGGVNLGIADPNFQPEKNVVGEIGAKRTLMGGGLRLNGDVFVSKYSDIQFASLIGAPPLPVTQNAAGGKSWGVELEANAHVGDFRANLGAGYLDAQFDGDSLLQNAVTNTNQLVPDGSRLPFSPDWTINAGAEYDLHFGEMIVTPRIQFAHLGEQLATPFPSSQTIVPARDVWDAKVTFEPTGAVQFEAFVTNFTDETYIASQVQSSSSATGGIIYGAPRQVGVRMKAKF